MDPYEAPDERNGATVSSRRVHPNTKARILQMSRECNISESRIVAGVLALYFGTAPADEDEQ